MSTRKRPPAQCPANYRVTEFLTEGFKTRWQASADSGDWTGPRRKSHNSAAADAVARHLAER